MRCISVCCWAEAFIFFEMHLIYKTMEKKNYATFCVSVFNLRLRENKLKFFWFKIQIKKKNHFKYLKQKFFCFYKDFFI